MPGPIPHYPLTEVIEMRTLLTTVMRILAQFAPHWEPVGKDVKETAKPPETGEGAAAFEWIFPGRALVAWTVG